MDELDIPILRKSYELYRTFHGFRNTMPKAERYTLWERIEHLILDSIEGILLASQLPKSEKLPHLERVSVKLNMLRIFLRLTKDTKSLDLKRCLQLQEAVDEIGRMLGGWIKSINEGSIKPSPSQFPLARERERERELERSGRKFRRAAARPMFELQLSSQLLLTLRPSASKLPTLTRLPSES